MACLDCKILKERVGDLMLAVEHKNTSYQRLSEVIRLLIDGELSVEQLVIEGKKLTIKEKEG